MDILSIPFHKYLNIKRSEDSDYLFEIQERPEYLNHLGTIHACVQLSLAEATSGEFLLLEFNELKEEVIPVVRKTEAKYHTPAKGNLYAKASLFNSDKDLVINDVNTRGRALLKIKVEVYDSLHKKSLTAVFDWFITKNRTE